MKCRNQRGISHGSALYMPVFRDPDLRNPYSAKQSETARLNAYRSVYTRPWSVKLEAQIVYDSKALLQDTVNGETGGGSSANHYFIRYLRVKVSPHAHLCRQLTHYTQTLDREWVPETRSLEPGIASKMSLATLVEWPSQVCTHRPSHCISSRSSEVVTRCPSWKVGMDCENPMRA